jgi:hypothetical protein
MVIVNAIVEPTGKKLESGEDEYVVNAQDSSTPVPVHWGPKEQCERWKDENCG